MKNFVFQNPTKIIFGKDTIASLTNEIPLNKRILVTFGGGSVKSNGVYEQVKEALKAHHTVEFWGIEPNPKYETLVKAIELAKSEKVDFILAVGGGSVLDGTKFIAAAACYDGEAWDLIVNQRLVKTALPIASVMTLPATGSEMNNGAVISRISTKEKHPFFSPFSFPQFSILDPQVTYSLPKFQVACGIIDTFVHTVEQYMTVAGESRVIDRWSEGILLSLVEIAPRAIADKPDYDTMADFMFSATMALNGLISMGVTVDWATHLIGHELTAMHGLTHAVTLAIVYPAMLKVMRVEKEAKILQYAERVWGITQGTVDERIDAAIAKTEQFFRSLGIATTLHENGVEAPEFATICDRFAQRGYNLGEKGNITPEVILQILNTCK